MRDNNVIIIVVIIAGNNDTFSVVYLKAKSDGVIWGIPLINIYPIKKNKIENVVIAESIRSIKISKDFG